MAAAHLDRAVCRAVRRRGRDAHGGRSFYADEAHGHRYWTHLSEELPDIVGSFFRVSERRADTFVAGLSMGGYGALKWALREPGPEDDLFALLEQVPPDALPRLYVGCGTEDHLYEMNPRFAAAAATAGAEVTEDFRPGEHEWGVWDAMIRDVLAWLPLRADQN